MKPKAVTKAVADAQDIETDEDAGVTLPPPDALPARRGADPDASTRVGGRPSYEPLPRRYPSRRPKSHASKIRTSVYS